MSERLQKRFAQARQNTESPIAYSGISPFALSELAQLDTSVARSCIEALVRTRALQAHPDVAQGQEDTIRELSPYFSLFKNTSLFTNAIKLHVTERTGIVAEHDQACREISEASRSSALVSERFARSFAEHLQDSTHLLRGEHTLVVLPHKALADLIHNPSKAEARAARGASGDSISFRNIPERDRNRLFAEARKDLSAEIEEEQVRYADKQMIDLHAELDRKYRTLISSDAPRNSRNAAIMKSYEELHDRYSNEAPLSKELLNKLHNYVVNAYKHEVKWSTDTSSIDESKEYEQDLEETQKALDLRLLIPRMERIIVRGGRTSVGPSAERSVIGVLDLHHELDHSDFTSSQFYKDASGSKGGEPRGLKPFFASLCTDLPAEYLIERSPKSHPSSPIYLVTAEYRAHGDVRLYVEGQVFGIVRADG